MSNTMKKIKLRVAPIEWLIDDLLTTILDAAPEELPELHSKLAGLALAIDARKDEVMDLTR